MMYTVWVKKERGQVWTKVATYHTLGEAFEASARYERSNEFVHVEVA